jgi:translocation and assembly module TamB
MRAASFDRRSILSRVGRIARVAALITVAAIALLVGGTWTFLETRWGGDAVRRFALPKVNAALAGNLDLGRFSFHGDRLTLEKVVLRDPAGAVVARVERIDLAFSPLSLLRHHLDVTRLAIARPELWLVADDQGTNLARALAPRKPAAPEPRAPDSSPSRTVVDLRKLTLTEGAIDFRSQAGDETRHAHVAELSVDGSLRFDARQSRAAVEATVDARGAHIAARGELDLHQLRALDPGLTVRARDLDLSALVDGTPASKLAFDLTARGGGRDPAALDGAVDFSMPAGRLDDQTVGPIRLAVQAAGGIFALTDLSIAWPGLAVRAQGTASQAKLDTSASIDLTNLRALAKSLAVWGITPPPLSGRAHLDLHAGGSFAVPSLQVTGDAPRLESGESSVRGLVLRGDLPDLRFPTAANIDLAAPRAFLGGQTLRGLKLSVHATGIHVSAHLVSTAPFPLKLAIEGQRDSTTRLTLNLMNLYYPAAGWSLARPAQLDFTAGHFAIRGFALRAGQERLEADLAQSTQGLRGRVGISKLDLGRLPRVFVPAALGLGGVVDADARFDGSAAEPRIDAKLSLAGGRFKGYHDLSLSLQARYAEARARGQLDARGLGTAIAARFDLPASWPIRDHQAPLLLDLSLAETDLAATTKALAIATGQPIPARLEGRAHLTARLEGTLQDPRLAFATGIKGLVVQGQTVGDVDLSFHGEGDRPLAARLEVRGNGMKGARTTLDLQSSLSLRAALRQPPTAETLARTPIELRGDIDRLPLAVIAQAARVSAPIGGTLTAHLALSGTALDPRGTFTADVAGASAKGVPATDARVELALERHTIDLHLRVLREQHPLLAAEVRLGAGMPALREPALLADAPLRLRAVVGPLQMQRLGLPPLDDREPPRVLKGRVHMDLAVDGTVRAPRGVWHTDADDIRLDKSLVGVAHVAVTYADRRAQVDARLVTANQGQLHAVADTTADLGYPAVTRGLDVRHLPLDVRLDAQRFDVQGLSGSTQELRSVGGLFSASANVQGTVADPRISGRLELTDGSIAVTGLGEYQAIHLALHGDDRKLTLDELTAKSGDGTARVTGDAAHGAGGYRFSARADVSRFPVYQEGQPLAMISVGTSIAGTAAPFNTHADIAIHNARIELSDAKRKNLQSLATPKDVVLVDAGQPLNRAQAARLRALVATRPPSKGSPAPALKAAETASAGAFVSAVRLTVNAPRKIWVTGKDAYFEIGLSPGFRVSMTDQTRVIGEVVVKRGRMDILGRRFDLKADSTLQFNGPTDRPELDVTAQYQNMVENVTVVLTAKGAMDHLAVTVTSPNRPDLTESQLYTLIVTGHLPSGGTSGSSSPSAEAASLLGGVLAAQLQKTLAKKLPLDVLTVDAGTGEGLTGTQLEAGRYVADKLYVGYVGRVGADPTLYQNRNAVHVEYQLSSRWGIDGEYGDVGTGSLDLTWKKNY